MEERLNAEKERYEAFARWVRVLGEAIRKAKAERALEKAREKTGLRARRVRLEKEDFITHGYTQGCPGCQALREEQPPRKHSEICRQRIEQALRQSEAGRERVERGEERILAWWSRPPSAPPSEAPASGSEGDQRCALTPAREAAAKRPRLAEAAGTHSGSPAEEMAKVDKMKPEATRKKRRVTRSIRRGRRS